MNIMNMKKTFVWIVGLVALSTLAVTAVAARPGAGKAQGTNRPAPFVDAVRSATARYQDVEVAKADGYGLLHGCVAGPQEGAMGIHFANPDLVGDGMLDAAHPEALLYEVRDGKY